MKALVVFCHPYGESFSSGILQTVLETLEASGAETRCFDLYKDGFEPGLTETEFTTYLTPKIECPQLNRYIDTLKWCDALFFVYPTWWYGLPALLKGWLDRVLVPGVAFDIPPDGDIEPRLTHIMSLGVFTTCGASRKLTWFVGAPGKRTLLRGVRLLCHPRCRSVYAAHYSMDASTDLSRREHIQTVERKLAGFLRKQMRHAA
ncbi:MAG: NAD(P)H-dependent oxidoreductase [Pseudomonadota bacterium]